MTPSNICRSVITSIFLSIYLEALALPSRNLGIYKYNYYNIFFIYVANTRRNIENIFLQINYLYEYTLEGYIWDFNKEGTNHSSGMWIWIERCQPGMPRICLFDSDLFLTQKETNNTNFINLWVNIFVYASFLILRILT